MPDWILYSIVFIKLMGIGASLKRKENNELQQMDNLIAKAVFA